MGMTIAQEPLFFPHAEAPPPGEVVEIARGVLWTRLALPFQLNHINIFLIEDGDGWAVLDTGINNGATRAAWDALVAGPLKGRNLTRLIVTHFHPDHIGLATGETLAHLRYLEEAGRVLRETRDGVWWWSAV